MSLAVETLAEVLSSSQTDSCKICGSTKLAPYDHTVKCGECGVLLFWPYPTIGGDSRNQEWDNWGRESVLPWYSRSSFYNHANFTKMILFAMDESYKGREVNVLDYGGGGGQFALVCKSLFPQAVIFTTDISDQSLLMEWKPLNNQIPFQSFGADRTKFDMIFLNDVLEHLTNPIAVLKQLKGKLTGDGMICIDTPKQFWLYPLTRLVSKSLHTKLLGATVHASHLQLWTRTSFMQALQRSGFRVSKYVETSEFTMPAEYYLDNMDVRHPAIRWLGKSFYRLAKVLASNKIIAVLESDQCELSSVDLPAVSATSRLADRRVN